MQGGEIPPTEFHKVLQEVEKQITKEQWEEILE